MQASHSMWLACILRLLLGRYSTSFVLQKCVNERIEPAGQVSFSIASFKVGTMVFDDIVRMNGDRADLRAEIGLDMFAFESGNLLLVLLLLHFVEASFQ